MTEEEWHSDQFVEIPLRWYGPRTTPRKLRLLSVALCYEIEDILDPHMIKSIQGLERFAEEQITLAQFAQFCSQAEETADSVEVAPWSESVNHQFRLQDAHYSVAWAITRHDSQETLLENTLRCIAGLSWEIKNELMLEKFRDIFGNPFRPVTLDPRWLTSTVLDLARTIYDERTFERMPILADALMDAGCDSEEIIIHCRGPGPHVRGCWVVDLLTGRE